MTSLDEVDKFQVEQTQIKSAKFLQCILRNKLAELKPKSYRNPVIAIDKNGVKDPSAYIATITDGFSKTLITKVSTETQFYKHTSKNQPTVPNDEPVNTLIRKRIAILSSKKNIKNYRDQNTSLTDIKYYRDDMNKDRVYIVKGAHYFHRENTGQYIYAGIIESVSDLIRDPIEGREYCRIVLNTSINSIVQNIVPGTKVPIKTLGGPGSTRYACDASIIAGCPKERGTAYRGILYNKQE